MSALPRVFRPTLLLVALLTLLAALPAAAQPADSVFRDFEPTGELQLEIDGEAVDGATVYRSDRAGAYLVLGPSLDSPILVNIRSQQVERVGLLKVAKRDDGTIDLLADAAFESIGRFRIGQKQIHFQLDGQEAVLAPKPPLLGVQTAEALAEHNPAYGLKAERYQVDSQALAALEGVENGRIKVFFGSWCPVCGRYVPRVMKVQEELGGAGPEIEYYGLPQPMSSDPITEEMEIRGVPTVIVYRGGEEVARLSGADLTSPAESFAQALGVN